MSDILFPRIYFIILFIILFGIFSDILSDIYFDDSVSPAMPIKIFQMQKFGRNPQRFSTRKSPARSTAILDLYESGEIHKWQMKSGDFHCTCELASNIQRGGGRKKNEKGRKEEGRRIF